VEETLMRSGQKEAAGKFDPEFRFLLDLDPALEGWRAWAAEYWASLPKVDSTLRKALCDFLVHYLHSQGLHKLALAEIFAVGKPLPELDTVLGLGLISSQSLNRKHDSVSDFLEWVLRNQRSRRLRPRSRLPAGA
jgi:hypothetical protein